MTAVVGVSLPLMIAVGSVLGHVLRRWSRDAQEQVGVVLRGGTVFYCKMCVCIAFV